MQRISIGAGIAALMLACCTISTLAQAPFKPAEVISVTDITYPIQSIADGVVVVDVSLDHKGAITGTSVVRDIPSLTSAATSSIQSWKFSPASILGKPVPSIMRVAVVFRPRSYWAAGPDFTPISSNEDPDRADLGYVPPGIISATYPQYPINAVTPGIAVVQVTVGKTSAIQRVNVVRDLAPFTQFALDAVNKWRFQPAVLERRPTASNLTIAFVFARILLNE
jgi:outer membrane biosynthesis protein TonB